MHLPCIFRRACSIKCMSLVVISIQTTSMVLLLRYSRTQQATVPLQEDKAAADISEVIIQSENSDHIAETLLAKPYVISTAVFLAEVLKLILSLFFLHVQNGFQSTATQNILHQEVTDNMYETCKLVVPAGLYLLQNNLLFVALTNLDAATYQVTYQLRILCTAAFSWLLLGRRLSTTHWLALAFLMVGVALVQVDAGDKTSHAASWHLKEDDPASKLPANIVFPSLGVGNNAPQDDEIKKNVHHLLKLDEQPAAAAQHAADSVDQIAKGSPFHNVAAESELLAGPANLHDPGSDGRHLPLREALPQSSANKEVSWLLGLLAVLVSCVLSGFAGVYFEHLVKRSRQTSLIVRNIQLGLFSMVFGVLSIVSDRRELWTGGFFQGYSWATWAVIGLQAFGGLAVSVTMKYADNILKVFATSVSIVLSTLLSSTLLGHSTPGHFFLLGTSIVLSATLLYGLAASPASSPTSSCLPLQPPRSVCCFLSQSSESEQATVSAAGVSVPTSSWNALTKPPSSSVALSVPGADTKVGPEAKNK